MTTDNSAGIILCQTTGEDAQKKKRPHSRTLFYVLGTDLDGAHIQQELRVVAGLAELID